MKILYTLVFLFAVGLHLNSQTLSKIDNIGTFQEGLTAIKKGDSWGFIDSSGTVVIDFRDDLVASPKRPPVFNSGLCPIKKIKNGITYFGYIDTKGSVVISPEYLAITPFENGYARVIKHYKTNTGSTNALGKNIVKYSYNEIIIDTNNRALQHLRGPINLLFDRLKLLQNPPIITSSFINKNLIAVKENDNTYTIYNLNKK